MASFLFHFIHALRHYVSALVLLFAVHSTVLAQSGVHWFTWQDVRVAIDFPEGYAQSFEKPVNLVLYALPNGNTIEWTMGRKMKPGDDWHFDIQHIAAQTDFVRAALADQVWIVAYLEANARSWPAWKQSHGDYRERVQALTDTLIGMMGGRKVNLYLNGHSGGGRFIFSYLDGVDSIPGWVKRISFLDSQYGYESTYLPKLLQWLLRVPDAALQLFAYNDSVALYQGKPVVSATGGTWYRSRLLLNDLREAGVDVHRIADDSMIIWQASRPAVWFFLKENPAKEIYHTVQVERNGFIHSLLLGTQAENKDYHYYRQRAYDAFIRE